MATISSSESQEATFVSFVYAICRSVQHAPLHTATLSRDKVARQSCAIKLQAWHRSKSQLWRGVMARRTVARLVFRVERCSILWSRTLRLCCASKSRVKDAWQNRRCDVGLTWLDIAPVKRSSLSYKPSSALDLFTELPWLATNVENLETYSGNSLNLENSWNSQGILCNLRE